MDATLDHLWVNGYGNTSVRDVVDKAGILKGSFYNYFDSKDDLVKAIVQAYGDAAIGVFRANLLDKTLPAKERFRRFFVTYREVYGEELVTRGCMLGNLCLETAGVNDELREHIESIFVTLEGIYRECLDDAVKAGEIPASSDTAQLAAFLHNGWHGMLLRMKSTRSLAPLDAFESAVSVLLFEDG